LGVVLTHSAKFCCNKKIFNPYRLNNKDKEKTSYFVAHLIEKTAEWSPYNKVDILKGEDLRFVEENLSCNAAISWNAYLKMTKISCPIHGNKDQCHL